MDPALDLLERSRRGLLDACASTDAPARYVAAHLSALRAAAAVLAVRGRPAGRSGRGPRSVWQLLPLVAPELTEWAEFFAASATRRAAIEAGRLDTVTTRDSDDLLRDAEAFHLAVEVALGLPRLPVLPHAVPACV